MATIEVPDQTAGRTYVAQFIRDSDGATRNGVSSWVADSTLTNAQLTDAIALVTTTPVVSSQGTHLRYQLTVPADVTVPCHVSLYLTSYTAGDEEDFGADYDPTDSQVLGYVDCLPASWVTVLDAAGVRAAIGMETANLDTQVGAIATEVNKVPRSGTTYKWTNVTSSVEADVEIGAAD